MEVWLHPHSVVVNDWVASRPSSFIPSSPGKSPGYNLLREWVGQRAGLRAVVERYISPAGIKLLSSP